jgi:hypothetical protein
MRQVLGGAVLVIAGIAAFIEASSHEPIPATALGVRCAGEACHSAHGLSQTAYDILRIGAWALVIVGALVVIMGLIRFWTTQKDRVRTDSTP